MSLVPVLVVVGLVFFGPIPQSLEYHHFADRRRLLGIPNFWDVLSNFPFLMVGFLGLRSLYHGQTPGLLPELKLAYFFFFLGTMLVGFGSGYYHLAPTNETLIWDRLPMTIAFMAFVAIVLGEHFSPRLGARSLFPLLLVGASSVAYWALTELAGRGDLRPYIFVQFVPMVLVPLVLIFRNTLLDRVWYFWALLACYSVAKALEHWDSSIFHCGEILGGHALKHLAAALGTCFVWLALKRRSPKEAGLQPIRAGT